MTITISTHLVPTRVVKRLAAHSGAMTEEQSLAVRVLARRAALARSLRAARASGYRIPESRAVFSDREALFHIERALCRISKTARAVQRPF